MKLLTNDERAELVEERINSFQRHTFIALYYTFQYLFKRLIRQI